jgi:nucleotide-binding universal stress UspA family protein
VSRPLSEQFLWAILFLGGIALGAVAIADDWSDLIVFGAVALTVLGLAIAVNKRQYPTGKRGFARESGGARAGPREDVLPTPSRLKTVAVGTDGSETAAKAVDFAIDMAERYGSKLVVISSYAPVPEDRLRGEQADAPQEIQWAINPMEDVEDILGKVEEKAHARGLETIVEARQGNPADVLCAAAEDRGADALVVGSKGMQRRILGSVPNTVSHKAPCSVVIVKTT